MTTRLLDDLRRALSSREERQAPKGSFVPSAVLILVYPLDGDYHILLHKRSQKVEHHKGDIAFPGGVQDSNETLTETAIRETHEEMGVDPADVDVLGKLDDTPTTANYLIAPYVGTIPSPYEFDPSSDEVDEILEVPASVLLDRENYRDDIRLVDGKLERIPCFAYDGHLIVGATAMILGDLINLIDETTERRRY